MQNKVLGAYAAADFFFVVCGVILLVFSIVVRNQDNEVTDDGKQAARDLLYQQFPLTGAFRARLQMGVSGGWAWRLC